MTFQWTAVAAFLYGEIGVILVLCLPFISPLRWQKIFMFPLWSKMAVFWNKMFLTIIVLLIILFLDAVREVRKYSSVHVNEKAANVNSSAFDHIQMKLFRSQRNLYLSGFSLFLWLVLRRTVTLLTQLAKEMASHAALETQVNDATEAAKKYMAENERLQEALSGKGNGKKKGSDTTEEKLKEEVEHLKAELQKTSNAFHKAKTEVAAVKKQSEGLRREYDHLMKEFEQLQQSLNKAEDKKDLYFIPVLRYSLLPIAVCINCGTSENIVLKLSILSSGIMWNVLFSIIKCNTCVLFTSFVRTKQKGKQTIQPRTIHAKRFPAALCEDGLGLHKAHSSHLYNICRCSYRMSSPEVLKLGVFRQFRQTCAAGNKKELHVCPQHLFGFGWNTGTDSYFRKSPRLSAVRNVEELKYSQQYSACRTDFCSPSPICNPKLQQGCQELIPNEPPSANQKLQPWATLSFQV
ncbi:hypothetical protein IHE44_0012558 [Lamprotornis superbus]|uniref:Endoplasmic reticulum transmembrane protein n=1 Tax=Lamprotornis superbus TaxID=245042 RepID=A0A835P332_9PASS|nr:hypothetical protein IHE44_0012558 [Lamprotornis superbus]